MTTTMKTDFVNDFPFPVIPKIIGEPDFESLQELQRKLSNNAGSIKTSLGGGAHGYIGLTVRPDVYFQLTGRVFQPPIDPGPLPNFPPDPTQEQMRTIERNHTAARALFKEYVAVGNALKQQLIGAVDDIYLRGLQHRVYGFLNVTVIQMIYYLFQNYGKITPSDLVANEQRMKAPYDVSTPIEHLWAQIEDAIAFAGAADAPFSPIQVMNTAYDLLYRTGMFKDTCKEWRMLAMNLKTYARLKDMFTEEHRDLRVQTAASQGYQTANMILPSDDDDYAKVAEALNELAQATAADRQTVANLTEANAALGSNAMRGIEQAIKNLSTDMKDMKNELEEIKRRSNSNSNSSSTTNQTNRNRNNRRNRTKRNKWCWSCGVGAHDSKACNSRYNGHQEDATVDNMMGSSMFGKRNE